MFVVKSPLKSVCSRKVQYSGSRVTGYVSQGHCSVSDASLMKTGYTHIACYCMLATSTLLRNAFVCTLLPPTKEEVHVFARVCLSVCPLTRLLKNACMDLNEMLRVDRCRDMDDPDYSPDAGTELLSPISYALQR